MTGASVLMPCRNAAATLPAAIASLETQTYTALEIIVVDDGSSDDTRAQLDAWAARDRRVRVIAQPPLGIVPALQRGHSACTAEVIVRMDADDIAHPRRIELQLALLAARPDIGACGTLVRCFPRDALKDGRLRYEAWINSLVTEQEIARDIFVECPIAHPSLAIRRDVLEAAGGYRDDPWPEDYDLLLRLWRRGVTMARVPEVLLDWRERTDRASRTDPRYDEAAFRRCKVHHLLPVLQPFDRIVICGAGPVGKAFARDLTAAGRPPAAFLDVDPRKIGQEVHGAPVLPMDALPGLRGAFFLAAVSGPGPRARIRAALGAAGVPERETMAVA